MHTRMQEHILFKCILNKKSVNLNGRQQNVTKCIVKRFLYIYKGK